MVGVAVLAFGENAMFRVADRMVEMAEKEETFWWQPTRRWIGLMN
jgi:hypothetical protein